jgi:formate transporter
VKKENNMANDTPISVDALLPPAMAAKAEDLGVKKAGLKLGNMFLLAILAGAFIGIGAIFATTVSAGSMAISDAAGDAAFKTGLPYGLTRLLTGLSFTVGLILVVVGGAELFTGNNLITMAFMSKKVTLGGLLRNWVVVWIGNLVGSMLTALIVFWGKQYTFGGNSIGLTALTIGNTKCGFTFIQAVALGIMCNALVCMAVWMCYSARSTTDKILAIIPPIACFVAAGFEHSVANMYFVPIALYIKYLDPTVYGDIVTKLNAGKDFANLTWGNFFLANLLPVTIGNIIGGAFMVGAIYWFVYLRKPAK